MHRIRHGILPLLAAALAAPTVPGQQRWRIPPGGHAVYAVEQQVDFRDHEKGSRRQLPRLNLPACNLLYQSELARDGRHVEAGPHELSWVAPWLAFDLRLRPGQRISLELPWICPLGHLRVRGRIEDTDATDRQRFELQIATVTPERGEADERSFARSLRACYRYDVEGTLELERQLDPAGDAVSGLRAVWALTCIERESGTRFDLSMVQSWRLQALRENRGEQFDARVATSVRALAGWIHGELAKATDPDGDQETDVAGVRALALLALLHAQYDERDTVVRARLAQLRRFEPTQTYTLALSIMVLEQLYAPAGEREALIARRIEHPTQRQPTPADLALLRAWTDKLLQNREPGIDLAYLSRWGYQSDGFDNSNTQFALLGLHSASLCGIEISQGVWHAAARHLLDVQCAPESRPERLQLVGHREAREQPHPLRLGRTAGSSRSRGFGYRGSDSPPYGSMTAAGISGATLCLAHLAPDNKPVQGVAKELEQAMQDGFVWLHRHRTLRFVPADEPSRFDWWWFYWLYSLERACELSPVAWIGEWDWYSDGAELLMSLQLADGQIRRASLIDNCFALLFLKQAQLPVLTGPRRR